MNLSLSQSTREKIEALVNSRRYESADAVISAALAALQEVEGRFGHFAPGELDELLAEGERSIAIDGTAPASKVFAELRQRGIVRGAVEH